MAVPIVLVGPPVGTPSTNISAYIDFATLVTEDTGNQADDTANFELLDIDLDVTDLAPNGRILVTQDGIDRFNGFITSLEPAWEGISRRFRVACTGISGLLDKCIIPPSGSAYVRNNGESDKSRIQWLLNTFGDPFLDAGSSSFTYIQTLDSSMPKQNFANLTLRQAIERVLGAASESANYYIDTQGRLHTWDNDNEEAAVAPFEIVTTLTLAATEVAPSDLRVMWDTSDLVNYYYVRGRNAAGSGAYSDADSIAEYGRWQAFIDGPDSDTPKKARRLGKAALKDTKNPILRTSFTVETDYCENGDGEIWRPGQMVTITSPAHGMTGYEIRVIRVTTSYLNGLGDRRMEVECGALRANFLGPDQWGTWGTKYPDPTLVIQPGPPVIGDIDGVVTEIEPDGPGPISGSTDISSALTEHELALPDGGDIEGRVLVLVVTWTDATVEDIEDDFTALGFTILASEATGTVGSFVAVRVIDTTEGYTGTDDILEVTTSVATQIALWARIFDSVQDVEAPVTDWLVAASDTGSMDPPGLVVTWADPAPTYWLALGVATGAAVLGNPTGYDTSGGAVGSAGLSFKAMSKEEALTSDDPDDGFTTTGTDILAWTIALRGAPSNLQPGAIVEEVVDHGDGTGTFTASSPFLDGSLRVWVDDIPIDPAVVGTAPSVGNFSLPFMDTYHDAANHPDGCAVVRVRYQAA